MEEIWPDLLVGFILITCGVLVKRFPMLISGYNTMPAEKRKNVDVEGLSSFMRRHLIIIGTLWAIIGVAFTLTGQAAQLYILYIIGLSAYLLWMIIRSQRYDHNK